MACLKRRGDTFYAQYYVGRKQKRVSLGTSSLQIAKEKLRQLESSLHRGEGSPLPTRTPLPDILQRYADHTRTIKTPKSAQTDVYYLRQVFGPICPALQVNSRARTFKAMKRPPKEGQDRRCKLSTIEASYLEQVATSDLSNFISTHIRSRGLAPKTANRYREIVNRLFNWAIEEQGVRMPGGANPVSSVGKYKEHAPKIHFLTLRQIDEQMQALEDSPSLRTLVAVYIYAGLRREEALWLTMDDVDLRQGPFGMIRIRGKTVNADHWEPKTKQNRAVPISSALRTYLERYTPMITPERWYFPSPNGKHYDPDNFSSDLRTVNQKAGLSWSCLEYRHTFGSQLAMKGESLYKILALMETRLRSAGGTMRHSFRRPWRIPWSLNVVRLEP